VNIQAVIDWLRPPPDLPEGSSAEAKAKHRNAVSRYRQNVTYSLLGIFVFGAWSLSPWGFARANDVDQHVQKALEPIQTEIATIKDAQTRQGKQLDEQNKILTRLSDQLSEQLIASTASQIRILIGKRCKEPPGSGERERINRELEKLQLLYKEKTGDRLQITCSEL